MGGEEIRGTGDSWVVGLEAEDHQLAFEGKGNRQVKIAEPIIEEGYPAIKMR